MKSTAALLSLAALNPAGVYAAGEWQYYGGDQGGRQIFSRHGARIAHVEVIDPLDLRDIDTVAVYDELLAEAERRGP